MSFDNWKARLAGQKVTAFVTPQAEDEGYYRKPLTQKKIGADGKANGQTEIIGWLPVAYFLDNMSLICLLNNKEVSADDEALWSWVVSNPISYATYHAVADDGMAWPELAVVDTGPRLSENVGAVPAEKPKEPVTAEDHKAIIAALIGSTAEAKVDADDEVNSVTGSINRLAEARLAADKAGQKLYKPPFETYKQLFAVWTPMVKDAETEEKRLARLVLVYRESVRKREAEEAAVAEKARLETVRLAEIASREEEERNQRAADRAIATGEEPPPPEVTEEALPAPVAEVAAPPPRTVVPTHGKRRVKEQEQTFVEITDIDEVFAYFSATAEVHAVLHTLALAATRAGRVVPGTTSRKGLV